MTTSSGEFLELQAALKGRFFLERELGRGGMGIVYLAHEVALDRPVALKLLPTELAADELLRERFLREARTAARLSHPNIVPIFAVDEVDDFVFFAMAYVEGRTLGERVRERGPLGHAEAARMLREVAWAPPRLLGAHELRGAHDRRALTRPGSRGILRRVRPAPFPGRNGFGGAGEAPLDPAAARGVRGSRPPVPTRIAHRPLPAQGPFRAMAGRRGPRGGAGGREGRRPAPPRPAARLPEAHPADGAVDPGRPGRTRLHEPHTLPSRGNPGRPHDGRPRRGADRPHGPRSGGRCPRLPGAQAAEGGLPGRGRPPRPRPGRGASQRGASERTRPAARRPSGPPRWPSASPQTGSSRNCPGKTDAPSGVFPRQ